MGDEKKKMNGQIMSVMAPQDEPLFVLKYRRSRVFVRLFIYFFFLLFFWPLCFRSIRR